MSIESRRTLRFQSLSDDHEHDKGNQSRLQCHFNVSYIGETAWRDEFTYVNQIMKNILPKQASGKFWLKKEPQIKASLFIDACTAAVCIENTEGTLNKRFKLCNIREVIYCGNMKEYSKYVILVVGGEADTDMKAHVVACSNVKEAKTAFKVLTDVFTRDNNQKSNFNLKEEGESREHVSDEIVSSPHLHLAKTGEQSERQSSLSEGEPISPEVEDHFVENAFTAFARSRSFNSGHGRRYTPGKRQMLLRS